MPTFDDALAHGYVRVDDALVREGEDPYGALASMGGIYSTVRDLARWVAGFLDAFPARDDLEGPHPLRRSSRREMQQAHRTWSMEVEGHPAHEAPVVGAGGYGYGLSVITRAGVGTIVAHGGGYPGYGTMMAWHPSSGLGVVGAANLRYGGVHALTVEQLVALVLADTVPRRALRPLPALAAAVPVVEALLAGWDDALADAHFAMNMDLDEARERRRAAVEKAVADVGGPLRPDADREVVMSSGAHRRWWLRGERGWIRVACSVSPEPSPRIQAMSVTAVLDPSAALRDTLDRLLGAADGGSWPAGIEAADGIDRALVMRGLRALLARFGPLEAGRVVAGDGRTTATWTVGPRVDGGRIRVDLDEDGRASKVEARFDDRSSPVEAW